MPSTPDEQRPSRARPRRKAGQSAGAAEAVAPSAEAAASHVTVDAPEPDPAAPMPSGPASMETLSPVAAADARASLSAANDQLIDGAAVPALFVTAGHASAHSVDSAGFSRSRQAAAELAAVLKQEFAAASRRGVQRLGERTGRLAARARSTDLRAWTAELGTHASGLAKHLRAPRAGGESGQPAGLAAAGEVASADGGRATAGGAGGVAAAQGVIARFRQWDGLRGSGSGAVRLGSRLRRSFTMRGAVRTLAVAAVAGVLLIAAMFAWALSDVPWREIAAGSLKPIVVLETADGKPLVQQGPFQGTYAKYDEFPPQLIDAVVSVEDRRFFDHHGVDLRGVARAMVRNLRAGEVLEGGSTITQQLIKVLYLESDRTWKRKLQELVIAFWLEAKLGKQEILDRYLNNVYLGAGATGMPAAARIYFNKEVGELNLRESAMLAGLIRSPSQLNPIDNYDGARNRASVVLDTMVDAGRIDAAQALAANAEFAELHVTRPAERTGSWFADWVSDQAREIAGPFRGSITVKTTIVPRLQLAAEKAVRHALDEEGAADGVSEAALVAMTPDGAVVAMVGGRDYEKSQFNRAATAMRQPGSTFKLFVYYAALKQGFQLDDRIEDGPIEIDGWSPDNASGKYAGRVSLTEAFARSLNGATVALAQEVGIENVAAAAKELGIDSALALTPALALGASEVSLLDLTGAYASVRAGVAPVEPWGIANFQAEGQPRSFRVGPGTAPAIDLRDHQKDLVTLLQLVVERGTGKQASPGVFAAGKTGTSQNNRDAWFVGFTEPLVAGVWVGNDDDTPMKDVTGGALPARIWRDFMVAALADGAPAASGGEVAEAEATEVEPAEEEPALACNVRACSRAYRSFRASDCTFQPYRGERRLCEK